jgi:hypothetical protein
MSDKPKLPIDEMTIQEFAILKGELLEEKVLSEETLGKIKDLFNIGSPNTGSINCDEYHPHSYKCINYKHPTTGVVDRLIQEIDTYREKLDELKNLIS